MAILYRFLVVTLAVPLLFFGSGGEAQLSSPNPAVSPDSKAPDSFVDLEFEELFDITISSVSRKEQKLSDDRFKVNDRNRIERSYFGKAVWRF